MSLQAKTKNQLVQKCRSLEYQRKFAWRRYYQSIEDEMDRAMQLADRIEVWKSNAEYNLPDHLMNEFLDLSHQLGKVYECPICLEPMSYGKKPEDQSQESSDEWDGKKLKISNCGHKYCSTCYATLMATTQKCSICRKKWVATE